jgi:hypothetical protein
VQDENEQCHNHLQTREIIESKKEVVAADFQSEGAYFVQQEHDETSSQVQILRADVPTSSMPFSSAICGENKCYNVIDNCDMQKGGESVSLQDFEYVSTLIFRVAYNLSEKRDQMFSLREYLEKKYVASASPSVIDESIQKQIEHVPPDQWLQHDVVPCLKDMSTYTTSSIVVCVELLDRDAEIKCANMPHEVQIEGITDINNSTEIVGVPPLELITVGCSTVTFAGQCFVDEMMKESDHVIVAQNIAMKALHQNPYEIESHIAKLSARENKSELCDSTKCEIESIHNECEGYTPTMGVRDIHHIKRQSLITRCMKMFMILTHSSLLVLSLKVCRLAKKLRRR